MTPLLTREEIRAVESEVAARAQPSLMERAGRATAELARAMAGDSGRTILVVAGPGNNGGDAWVAAADLVRSFHRVLVLDVTGRTPAAAEARAARGAVAAGPARIAREWPEGVSLALVVDGLLGIGVDRDVDGPMAALVERINASGAPVLAIDTPSGLDTDSGRPRGPTVRAARTLTFIAGKPGLFTGPGRDLAGEVTVDDLGTADAIAIRGAQGALLRPEDVKGWLRPREASAHKGHYGTLAVIGGNRGMVGAALLAARTGVLAGAGKVRAALLSSDASPVDPAFPEIMVASIDDAMRGDVVVLGPGAGQSPSATSISAFERTVMPAAFALDKPLVLDADALNAVAYRPELEAVLAQGRNAPTVLTPHPAEAARMLDVETEAVQADRVKAARELAKSLNAHVVLKGAGSVLAFPDGRWMINTTGNPGMASGGMGDVLAGLVGALLCQGLPADRALAYAVCLHGAAADALVARGIGPIGLAASEVAYECRAVLNAWTRGPG